MFGVNTFEDTDVEGDNHNVYYDTDKVHIERYDEVSYKTKPCHSANLMTNIEVIQQDKKSYMNAGEQGWRKLAKIIMETEHDILPRGDGVFTVICLDTSASMAENDAWTQANIFISDYLEGLEAMRIAYGRTVVDEYVSLVTFGHATNLQVMFTKRYTNIRTYLQRCVKLGGPSQLNGGLFLAQAAACAHKNMRYSSNGITINPKIVIITDGYPTDICLLTGPDDPELAECNWIQGRLVRHMHELLAKQIDVFCVPVGNFNQKFLGFLSQETHVKLRNYGYGGRLARRQYLCKKAETVGGSGLLSGLYTLSDALQQLGSSDPSGFLQRRPLMSQDNAGLSHEDQEDIADITTNSNSVLDMLPILNRKIIFGSSSHLSEHDVYEDLQSDRLPPVGTRVRRGPDWDYDVAQDEKGPGTVVGHVRKEGRNRLGLWVEWDANGAIFKYRYSSGRYDVLTVDEPRKLKHFEKMAVGCVVIPGKCNTMVEIDTQCKGVVIRMLQGYMTPANKAWVLWDNGTGGDYYYGDDGKFEIVLWKNGGNPQRSVLNRDSGNPQRCVLNRDSENSQRCVLNRDSGNPERCVLNRDSGKLQRPVLSSNANMVEQTGKPTKNKNADIEIRRARMADKDAVLGIHDNVFDGQDYLPSYYEKFIASRHFKCYIASLQDVVVGFGAEQLVDGGRTSLMYAARVNPYVRGTGVFMKIHDHVIRSTEAASHVFFVDDTNPAIHREAFKAAYNNVLTRSMSDYVFEVDQLAEFKTAMSSMRPLHPDKHLLERYMTSSTTSQYLFPNNRMIVHWVPYMLMSSNIPLFNIYDSMFVSDVTEKAGGVVSGMLSVSTIYACKCPPFACHIDIHGSNLSSLRDHVLSHLSRIFANVKGTVGLSVFMNQDSDINELKNVLEEFGISEKIPSDQSTVSKRQYLFETK